MKTITVSYKQLCEIVSALELKLTLTEATDRSTLTEDEIADLNNDIGFLIAIINDLRDVLGRWQSLPSARK